jgi:hypothetical protein
MDGVSGKPQKPGWLSRGTAGFIAACKRRMSILARLHPAKADGKPCS